jgi:hypothetical protein
VDNLECPSTEAWEQRRLWFESVEEEMRGQGAYLVSEQACALAAEVQSVFCTGAWLAVLVMGMAVVDAQLRETETTGFRGNTKALLDEAGANPKLQELRRKRNRLLHLDPSSPGVTVEDQWENRPQMEVDAREAVRLMFEAFYMSPWV